jgi:transcriptional regulator with XRE-family HTH domain
MNASPESLRLILGLRVRAWRGQRGWTLKEFGERAGLSISYLSEIEQGRKYPKPAKLLALARGLGVPYDELVALSSHDNSVESLLRSPLIGGFPFEAFGVRPEDVVRVLSETPDRARALARAFVELGRTYDLKREDVLLAALRSYQEMHDNYFPDLEEAAATFRFEHGIAGRTPPSAEFLRGILAQRHGYRVDDTQLGGVAELRGLRSVFVDGKAPRLLINPRLMPSQRAFVLARELGYRVLGLRERALTSSWIQVDSFEQVLNNFKASYFAGAVLLEAATLREEITTFFAQDCFRGSDLLAVSRSLAATPELLFHRLTELLPRFFGLKEMFFVRFSVTGSRDVPRLTKVLNLSGSALPHGVGRDEHYCARWPASRALAALLAKRGAGRRQPTVSAARVRWVGREEQFFSFAVGRSLALDPQGASSVALGLKLDEKLRAVVRFADDPEVENLDAGLTCERCALQRADCGERLAPATQWRQESQLQVQQRALAALLESG